MAFFRFKEDSFLNNEKLHEAVDFSIEIIKIIIISLAIIVPVRYFLIQPFYVKGASMEPNFYNHEYLIINEISYRFHQPERGDVIIFKPPRSSHGDYFIKRIIGLPGERVELKDGRIKVYNQEFPQGIIIDESMYLSSELKTQGQFDLTLIEEEYFVVGDNRTSSLDSRTFGPIEEDDIIGKIWLRGWPLDRVMIFETPQYNL